MEQDLEKQDKIKINDDGEERVSPLNDTTITSFLKRINTIPLLTPDQELAYLKDYKTYTQRNDFVKAKDVQNKIIKHNLRLVVKVAKKYVYNTRQLGFMDLIQEGSIGLAKAIEKFDVSKNMRLSTYAVHWIVQNINYCFRKNEKTVRVPNYLQTTINQYKKFIETFKLNNNNIEPTKEQVKNGMCISDSVYASIQKAYNQPLSFSMEIGFNEDASTIGDTIEEKDVKKLPEHVAELNILKDNINECLKSLSVYEKLVIERAYGLNQHDHKKVSEIANELNYTQTLVRQLMQSGLRKLRDKEVMETLIDFYVG